MDRYSGTYQPLAAKGEAAKSEQEQTERQIAQAQQEIAGCQERLGGLEKRRAELLAERARQASQPEGALAVAMIDEQIRETNQEIGGVKAAIQNLESLIAKLKAALSRIKSTLESIVAELRKVKGDAQQMFMRRDGDVNAIEYGRGQTKYVDGIRRAHDQASQVAQQEREGNYQAVQNVESIVEQLTGKGKKSGGASYHTPAFSGGYNAASSYGIAGGGKRDYSLIGAINPFKYLARKATDGPSAAGGKYKVFSLYLPGKKGGEGSTGRSHGGGRTLEHYLTGLPKLASSSVGRQLASKSYYYLGKAAKSTGKAAYKVADMLASCFRYIAIKK